MSKDRDIHWSRGRVALWIVPILILLLAVVVVALLQVFKAEAVRVEPKRSVLAVEVVTVAPQVVALEVHSQGSMQAWQQTDLFAEVPGKVVWVSPRFEAGQRFEEGEDLLRLESIDYEVALAQARAAWQQAELDWVQEQAAQAQAQRDWENLGRGGSASDLALRKPQLARAKQAMESAAVQLRLAEKNVERTRVRAPYAGRVLSRAVDVGQFVQAGGVSPLGVVYATGVMELRLPMSEREFMRLGLPDDYSAGKGETVLAVSLESTVHGEAVSWQGVVHRVEGAVDPVSRLLYVVVRLSAEGVGDERWPRLQEFVSATVWGRQLPEAFVLPSSALVGTQAVRVVDEENILRVREVEVAQRRRGEALVVSGLQAGDRVCVTPLSYTVDGIAVEVVSQDD